MLLLIGLVVAALIFLLNKPWSWIARGASAVLFSLLAFVLLLFLQGMGLMTLRETRGDGLWYEVSPWREAILFLFLVIGILARGIFDVLNEHSNAQTHAATPSKKRLLSRIVVRS